MQRSPSLAWGLTAAALFTTLLGAAAWVRHAAFVGEDSTPDRTTVATAGGDLDARAPRPSSSSHPGASRASWPPPRDPAPHQARTPMSPARPTTPGSGPSAGERLAEISSSAQGVAEHDRVVPPNAAILSPPSLSEVNVDPAREQRGLAGVVLEDGGLRVGSLPITARGRALTSPIREYQTFSDGRGAFSFPEVPDGEYVVRTAATDLYDSASAVLHTGSEAVLVVQRKSDETFVVRGVVANADGGALSGVRVDAIGLQGASTVSDSTGGYTVRIRTGSRAETAALRFRCEGFRERRLAIQDAVRISDREFVADVRLDPLSASAPVTGVVAGDDGNPVDGAAVQLDSALLNQSYRAVSDSAGRFRFAAVEEGRDYILWVRARAGYRDERRENVRVGAPGTSLDVVLRSLGVASLTGHMVDPQGQPVAGFTLWLTAAYGTRARSVEVTGDTQGRFLVERLPEGPAVLATRAGPRISVSGIVLAPVSSTDITAVIDVGVHRLDGRILSEDGRPIAGAAVSLQWSSSDGAVTSRSVRETITDSEGYFFFAQVGPAVHTLRVSARGFASTDVQQRVGAGLPPLELRLRRTLGISSSPR